MLQTGIIRKKCNYRLGDPEYTYNGVTVPFHQTNERNAEAHSRVKFVLGSRVLNTDAFVRSMKGTLIGVGGEPFVGDCEMDCRYEGTSSIPHNFRFLNSNKFARFYNKGKGHNGFSLVLSAIGKCD